MWSMREEVSHPPFVSRVSPLTLGSLQRSSGLRWALKAVIGPVKYPRKQLIDVYFFMCISLNLSIVGARGVRSKVGTR